MSTIPNFSQPIILSEVSTPLDPDSGFLKVYAKSGALCSVANGGSEQAYLTSSSVTETCLPLSGGTLTGDLTLSSGRQLVGTESKISLSSGAGGQLAGFISTSPVFSVSSFGGFRVENSLSIGWANFGSGLDATPDLRLYRGGAGILEQRNGLNAQCFDLFETYTSSTNNGKLRIKATSSGHQIGSARATSGSNRAVQLGHFDAADAFTSAISVPSSGDVQIARNLVMSGTFPYFGLTASSWSGGTFYFQAGVDETGTGTGNFTCLINPVTKSFAILSGNPNTSGKKHLTIDGSTSLAVFGGAITASGAVKTDNLYATNWLKLSGTNQTTQGIAVRNGDLSLGNNVAIGWSTTTDPTANQSLYSITPSSGLLTFSGAITASGTVTISATTQLALTNSAGVQRATINDYGSSIRFQASSSGYPIHLQGNNHGIRVGDGTYTVDIKPVASNSVIGFYTGQGTTAASGALADIACGAITASGKVTSTLSPDNNGLNVGFGWTDNGGEIGMSQWTGQNRLYLVTSGTRKLGIHSNGVGILGTLQIGTSMSNLSGGVTLTAGGDDILRQRNGLVPQTFQIANTYTSSTSFGVLDIRANSGQTAYEISSFLGSAGGANLPINVGHRNSAGTFTSALSIATSGAIAASGTVTVSATTQLALNSSAGVQRATINDYGSSIRLQASSSDYPIHLQGNNHGIRVGDGTYTVDIKPVASNSVIGFYTGQGTTAASGALADIACGAITTSGFVAVNGTAISNAALSITPSASLPKSLLVKGNASYGSADIYLDRLNTSYTNNIYLLTAGVNHWAYGQKDDGTQNFGIYNFGTATHALTIDKTTNSITASGRITATSNVTTSGQFIANASGLNMILLNSAGTVYGSIGNDAGDKWSLGYKATTATTLGTPVLTWTASGFVGINKVSPTVALDVNGAITASGTVNYVDGTIDARTSMNHALTLRATGAANAIRVLDETGVTKWAVDSTGSMTIGTLGYITFPHSTNLGDPNQIITAGGTGFGIKTSGSLFVATGGTASTFTVGTTGNVTSSGSIQETPTQSALDPTTSDIPAGKRMGWYNSTTGEFRDWVNIGGTLKKSAAYT